MLCEKMTGPSLAVGPSWHPSHRSYKRPSHETSCSTAHDVDTFTSLGLTTVQPATHGSPNFTHLTGAVPTEGENTIIEGAGRFSGLETRVRLSEAVDLSRLSSDNVIAFDGIFVVHPLS